MNIPHRGVPVEDQRRSQDSLRFVLQGGNTLKLTLDQAASVLSHLSFLMTLTWFLSSLVLHMFSSHPAFFHHPSIQSSFFFLLFVS